MSIADELERLKKLHESGALSTEEFERAKNAALGKSSENAKPRKKEPKKYGCFSTGCIGIIVIWIVVQFGTCSTILDGDSNDSNQAKVTAKAPSKKGAKEAKNNGVKPATRGNVTTGKIRPALLHEKTGCTCFDEVEHHPGKTPTKIPEGTTLSFDKVKKEPLSPGSKVENRWFQVTYEGETGWISEMSTNIHEKKKKAGK